VSISPIVSNVRVYKGPKYVPCECQGLIQPLILTSDEFYISDERLTLIRDERLIWLPYLGLDQARLSVANLNGAFERGLRKTAARLNKSSSSRSHDMRGYLNEEYNPVGPFNDESVSLIATHNRRACLWKSIVHLKPTQADEPPRIVSDWPAALTTAKCGLVSATLPN
jgi:hypothetical protein